MDKIRVVNFIIPKLKYAATALVATSFDYLSFFLLIELGVFITTAQFTANAIGLLINFFMLKKFVFKLNRSVLTSFQLVLLFAIMGLGLSTYLVHILHKISFFNEHLIILKILVTGIIFLYNFYTKRFSFEKSSSDIQENVR